MLGSLPKKYRVEPSRACSGCRKLRIRFISLNVAAASVAVSIDFFAAGVGIAVWGVPAGGGAGAGGSEVSISSVVILSPAVRVFA